MLLTQSHPQTTRRPASRRSAIRIGLITTLNTNIGDDFIREGLLRVVKHVFKRIDLSFVPINKHTPKMLYPGWHPARWTNSVRPALGENHPLNAFIGKYAPRIGMTAFDKCDLIIQCGAPIMWHGCSATDWRKEIWEDVVGRLHQRVPVLNLAGGSCYPWLRQPTLLKDEADKAYLRMIFDFCKITTVRDPLAQKIFASVNRNAILIPCSAMLASDGNRSPAGESHPIIINYMQGGGHYRWNQNIDELKWENTIVELVKRLGTRHKILMLCHDQKELDLAAKIAPAIQRRMPANPEEYFALIRNAKTALCNRMHASVAMAGLGIPSIAVCTDTRLSMVREFGLPTHFVEDTNPDMLESEIEHLIAARASEDQRLKHVRQEVFQAYAGILQSACSVML